MIYDFSSNIMDDGRPVQGLTDFRSDVEQNEPLLGVHNPDSPDLAVAESLAKEMIRTSGAKVDVFARTNNADFNETWDEDSDPTYGPPVRLRGFFKPQPMEFELKRWGIDAINKTEVVFCVSDLREQFGDRMLRPGDVVRLPYASPAGDPGEGGSLSPSFYRVVNAAATGNYRYHWLYFTCQMESLTADVTVRPENDMPMPNVLNDSGRGGYG